MRGAAGGSVRACGRFGICLWACAAGLLGSLLALLRVFVGWCWAAVCFCVVFGGSFLEELLWVLFLCGFWVLWVC